MAAQDGLYTLVIRHSDGIWAAWVIGSIVEYLFAADDPEAAIVKTTVGVSPGGNGPLAGQTDVRVPDPRGLVSLLRRMIEDVT